MCVPAPSTPQPQPHPLSLTWAGKTHPPAPLWQADEARLCNHSHNLLPYSYPANCRRTYDALVRRAREAAAAAEASGLGGALGLSLHQAQAQQVRATCLGLCTRLLGLLATLREPLKAFGQRSAYLRNGIHNGHA